MHVRLCLLAGLRLSLASLDTDEECSGACLLLEVHPAQDGTVAPNGLPQTLAFRVMYASQVAAHQFVAQFERAGCGLAGSEASSRASQGAITTRLLDNAQTLVEQLLDKDAAFKAKFLRAIRCADHAGYRLLQPTWGSLVTVVRRHVCHLFSGNSKQQSFSC